MEVSEVLRGVWSRFQPGRMEAKQREADEAKLEGPPPSLALVEPKHHGRRPLRRGWVEPWRQPWAPSRTFQARLEAKQQEVAQRRAVHGGAFSRAEAGVKSAGRGGARFHGNPAKTPRRTGSGWKCVGSVEKLCSSSAAWSSSRTAEREA